MKKFTIEILINFSKIKKENEEVFSQGEKLIKTLIKELKAFLSPQVGKLFKINTTNIGKEIEDLDISRFKGFVVDPSTLRLLKEKLGSEFSEIDVVIFNPFEVDICIDPNIYIYGIFNLNTGNLLSEKYKFLDNFIFFIISLMKRYNLYREEEFVYTVNKNSRFIYNDNKDEVNFINNLKGVIKHILARRKDLKDIREKYTLYNYKLREKLVIKDPQRRGKEIIQSLRDYSEGIKKRCKPFPSLLFVYENSIHRDIFREWFLEKFLSSTLKDIPIQHFSVYSFQDAKEFFGYIPVNLKGEEIVWGEIFENQGNIILLEDIPSSYEFFERLFYYTALGKLSPYGKKIEIVAPSVFVMFLSKENFEKFKNYLSFTYIFKIPDPFLGKDPFTILSLILQLYMKNIENITITYEALSFLEEVSLSYGVMPIIFALKNIYTNSLKTLKKSDLQEALRQFI